jgi:hypothetical protein
MKLALEPLSRRPPFAAASPTARLARVSEHRRRHRGAQGELNEHNHAFEFLESTEVAVAHGTAECRRLSRPASPWPRVARAEKLLVRVGDGEELVVEGGLVEHSIEERLTPRAWLAANLQSSVSWNSKRPFGSTKAKLPR